MSDTPLIRALRATQTNGGDFAFALRDLSEYKVSDPADARAIAGVISSLDLDRLPAKNSLQSLVSLLQGVASQEVFNILSRDALPALLKIFDRAEIDDDDKLFFLKIFALFPNIEGISRIIQSARLPLQPTAYLWSIIFQALPPGHPLTAKLVTSLASPLPESFIGIAYLDLANLLAAEGKISQHPFNSPEGISRLQSFLTSNDPRQFSYANSAAAALPFIRNRSRDALMSLAMNHPDANVKMRAVWSSAKLGHADSAGLLSKMCLDPRHSQTAWGYLESLNRQELIPIEAQRPDFRAMAEMCNWLAHPMEHGRPPDKVEVYDTREMNWPPTNDRRRLWLLKFKYDDEISIGMVGSITFSLAGEKEIAKLSPEDIYALHCCWELQQNKDPRAPKQRNVEAGRTILGLQPTTNR